MASGTACAIIYGLYPSFSDPQTSIADSLLDVNTAAFYNALSRPMWTMALAWVVIACVNGYGGEFFNRIYQLKVIFLVQPEK